MTQIEHIVQAIGREEMTARLGIGKTAISNAIKAGQFPARWYHVVRSLAAARSVDCPDDLFSFVRDEAAK